MTLAMHKAVRTMLDDRHPDAVLNIESHFYDMTIMSPSCEYELDVGKHLWLNKGRWSRLIKEYVPRVHLDRFVSQSVEIVCGEARQGATANMLFRDPDRYAKKHRWGGCLMGATFRGSHPDQPTITFYSRTTYVGYMGLLDAGIAHNLAREICTHVNGLQVKDIAFRWCITSGQLHCFKTLPFVFSQPDLMKKLEQAAASITKNKAAAKAELPPTWYHMAVWYNKILAAHKLHGLDMLAHEKYGPFKRIKRRWMEHKRLLSKHVPPSLNISTLGFEKAE